MWSFHSWLRGGMRALNRKFKYALQVGSALIGSEFWGRDHLPVRAQNTIEQTETAVVNSGAFVRKIPPIVR